MFDNYTQDEIQRRLAQLPEVARDAIYGPMLTGALQRVGTEHHLHLDQLSALEADTTNVVLGFIDPVEFPQAIAEHCDVDLELAASIAHSLETEFFQKIREAMRNGTSLESSGSAAPKPTPDIAQIPRSAAPQPVAQTVRTPIAPAPSTPSGLPVETYPELEAPHEEAARTPYATPAALVEPTTSTPETVTIGIAPGAPRTPAEAPVAPTNVPPPPTYTLDPYREPIS